MIGACREDSFVTNTVVDEPIPTESFLYEFGIFGLVVDEDGQTLDMASVVADGITLMSDENGYFEFEDLLAGDEGVYISAEKNGYIDGGVLVFPNEENTQQIRIVLIADNSSTLIDNSEGGVVNLEGGSQVIIPANAFAEQNSVRVNAHFIPSSKENFSKVYPSAFVGIDKSEEIKHLNSIGAVVVEFVDENGNEVELNDNIDVTLRLPIPDGDWPNTISLWSLDENSGYWIEESSATKVGDFYEGSVNHFSWWSACDPQDLVNVCFYVKTPEAEVAAGFEYFVLSWSENNPGFLAGFTDEDGAFCGKVPEGVDLAVVILDECSNSLYDEVISLSLSDSEREIIINSLPAEVLFEGTITRCDGTVVQDGYLGLSIGYDQVIVSIEDGAYSHTSYCGFQNGSEVEVLAVDKSDLSSANFSIAFDSEIETYTNDIALCETLETFMNFRNVTTGEEIVLISCEALKNPTETVVVAKNPDNGGESVLLGIEGFEVGTFGTSLLGPNVETALPSTFSTTITSYQAVGGYVEGTFSGTTDMGETIEGQFRADRTK